MSIYLTVMGTEGLLVQPMLQALAGFWQMFWNLEQQKIEAVRHRNAERQLTISIQTRQQVKTTFRELLTSSIDLVLPGNAIGWFHVRPNVLGILMLFTTYTSSIPVWDHLGTRLNDPK